MFERQRAAQQGLIIIGSAVQGWSEAPEVVLKGSKDSKDNGSGARTMSRCASMIPFRRAGICFVEVKACAAMRYLSSVHAALLMTLAYPS